MASSYPPPPASPSDGAGGGSGHHQHSPISAQAPLHSHYDSLGQAASQSTVAAAHHGLQALQAATAGAAPIGAPGGSPQYPPVPSPLGQGASPYAAPQNGMATSPQTQRQTRLRRACDMCSARKVKCDVSGPPCRPCASLGVECTFSREMKRRGPPNKHAEAAKVSKQRRLDPNLSPSPHHAAETLVSMGTDEAGHQVFGAEAIAPKHILDLLVDDFFTYIHPLTPFPHEPSFRQSFAERLDRESPEFLALIASMIGVLVASFPRSAKAHLKSQQSTALFARAIDMIEKCRMVALEARGPFFYGREEKTVNDAATSYFLALAAGYTFQFKLFRRFMAESISLVQEMGYHRRRDPNQQPSALQLQYVTADSRPFNHIDDQIGKRIFYILLLGVRSMNQLGAPAFELVFPPHTENDPYPDKPLEVDDEYIYPQEILGQPASTLSLMTGFNKVIDIYLTMGPIASVELAYGITQVPWSDMKTTLDGCLATVKQVTTHMPLELLLEKSTFTPTLDSADPGSSSADAKFIRPPPTDYFADLPGFQYYPPGAEEMQSNDLRLVIGNQPERRRQVQYDIQKSNIYASQLATRSFFVEFYLNLRDAARAREHLQYTAGQEANNGEVKADTSTSIAAAAIQAAAAASAEQADAIDISMASERELIVQDLQAVLAAIPLRNMEPNGSSLINKIRQVASTLLKDAPERKGPVAQKAEDDLRHFVEIVMRLEKGGGYGGGDGGPGAMTPEDEDHELRDFADLRDYQTRFAQSGGFLSNP